MELRKVFLHRALYLLLIVGFFQFGFAQSTDVVVSTSMRAGTNWSKTTPTDLGCPTTTETINATVTWTNNGPSDASGITLSQVFNKEYYIPTGNSAPYAGFSYNWDITNVNWATTGGAAAPNITPTSGDFDNKSGTILMLSGYGSFTSLMPTTATSFPSGSSITISFTLNLDKPVRTACGSDNGLFVRSISSFDVGSSGITDTSTGNDQQDVYYRMYCTFTPCPEVDIVTSTVMSPVGSTASGSPTVVSCLSTTESIEIEVTWTNNGPENGIGVVLDQHLLEKNRVAAGGGPYTTYTFPWDVSGFEWTVTGGAAKPTTELLELSGTIGLPTTISKITGLESTEAGNFPSGSTITLSYTFNIHKPIVSGCANSQYLDLQSNSKYEVGDTDLFDTNTYNNTVNNYYTIEVDPIDLEITKSVSPSVLNSGETLTMEIEFANTSSQSGDASWEDDLPADFTLNTGSITCTPILGSPTCVAPVYDAVNHRLSQNISNMPGNSALKITFTGVVDNLTTETITTGVTAIAGCVECDESTNTAQTSYEVVKNVPILGTPMITQVFQTSGSNLVEITNVHSTNSISTGELGVYLFKNKSGPQTGVTPDFADVSLPTLASGESCLVTLDIAAGDDIVILANSSDSNSNLWVNRIDMVNNISDNSSLVRIDEVLLPNSDFTDSEWVKFVDDDLDPYRDLASGGPERHPHAPLLSEITNANSESNMFLGQHRINPIIKKSGSFTNGEPDITRKVVINENYSSNSDFSVRELSVTDGNRLTMNGSLLRVLEGLSLTHIESEIRLEGVSQLIQIHNSTSKASGLGAIHVDQNSPIASIYRFNYMSSPVGGSSYTVADVLKVGLTSGGTNATSQIEDINFVSGYDGGVDGGGGPIKIAEHWIYTFASADGENSNWVQKLSTGSIPSTDGFTIKGPGVVQTYTFAGIPNDGEFTTSIGAGNAYLVGNPYPSALSSKRFIEDNENSISGTLYFWQHAGEEDISSSNIAGHYYDGYIGGYATRNIAMGLAATQVSSNSRATSATIGAGDYTAPGAYIPIGQGFFIEGDSDGGPIVFNNSQREFIEEGSESVFLKSNAKKSASLPIIKLGMNYSTIDNVEMHRQIGISFNSNNTFDFETGYDSELFDLSNSDMYWKFSSDASKYVIAGVEEISPELQVPLEIVLEKEGEVSIEIDEWNLTNQAVYLFDNLTNKFYPLHEEKAVLNLEKGAHTDRFFISFTKKQDYVLGVSDELVLNNLPIFYNKFTEEININPSENITISKVELYSILGQKVQSWEFKDHTAVPLKLQVNTISEAVYITKVTTNKGVFSKKIIIQ